MPLRGRFTMPRRTFVELLALAGVGLAPPAAALRGRDEEPAGPVRRFHAAISVMEPYPELPEVIAAAGVTDVWMAGFLYGSWYLTPDKLAQKRRELEAYGLRVHPINVPLGHPGNALGVTGAEGVAATPPARWHMARAAEGYAFSGTSIHPPAPAENAEAVRQLAAQGFDRIFLDDDFRLAQSPGAIGGCFCDECREAFLSAGGYQPSAWQELLGCVAGRSPGAILLAWQDFWCDRLEGMFRQMQAAGPNVALGIMVMYLGAEKAGVRLDRFGDVPFRVGELMFSDAEFTPTKGKTDELFSALFHRRFTPPDLAYSESTAWPETQLSAANMAAKLTISLIADVRKTMFMSGLMPFPIAHWDTLGPAMRHSARLHQRVAGHRPAGPFKHYWGMDSRRVGNDCPFSLFLASGVPFEVVSELPTDGWAFLSDADARAVAEGRLKPRGRNLIVRPQSGARGPGLVPTEEDLSAMMRLKESIVPALHGVPYVAGTEPVVFAWYPGARAGLLWNLEGQPRSYSVMRDGRELAQVSVPALGVELIGDL
jgi:hypothetical protein